MTNDDDDSCPLCNGEGYIDNPLSSACGGRWFRYCDCADGDAAAKEDRELYGQWKSAEPANLGANDMPSIAELARRQGRNYITPDDVSEALEHHPADQVRMDVLAVLGKQTDFGAEDASLCAFIAWRGTPTP